MTQQAGSLPSLREEFATTIVTYPLPPISQQLQLPSLSLSFKDVSTEASIGCSTSSINRNHDLRVQGEGAASFNTSFTSTRDNGNVTQVQVRPR
jgi:hypothetical protein